MKKYIVSILLTFLFFSTKVNANNLRSDTINVLKYTINLNITDFTTNTIRGNTQIKFTPKINGVTKLSVDLLKLTIDSIESGTINLTYSYNDTLLRVNLPGTYNINDTTTVTVYYRGTPKIDASNWGGFYFQSGYAYNLGVGFQANPHVYGRVWFPCFDNFVERSKYEFNITTNGGKISYCNGYLAKDTTDGNGDRTRRWIMEQEIPTYLASVAVANYTEINQTYNGINGAVPIVIAAAAADTIGIKNSFINLNLALSTYENHFGAYKWNRVGYTMVPFSSGAMEHATNIAYPRSFATGSLTYQTLYAHELSHHWFGDLATCRTQEDMWLNEGWAHYCEFLFTEALSGYTNYISAVRSNHQNNLQFNHVEEGGYLTLSNIPFAYTYGRHVYDKGADVAHTMRGYMGDSLFFYSVKTYLAQNNYKDVSSADFRNALTAASGMDMTNFFNDWVFNPGWTHFSIDSFLVTPNGPNYNVTVYVKQKLTGAPNHYTNVPLEITFKAANWTEQIQQFIMTGTNASFNFTVPFNPVFVAVNMGEKISDAIAPEYKKIKTTGGNTFSNTKMTITVLNISDSAFVRVEHNYTAPDAFKSCCIPYRMSPNHYWKVDGILPGNFKAKATLNYQGGTSSFTGNFWLDNNLINTYEDSLVLMYRKNAGSEWYHYPYYTKNYLGNNNNKAGFITIDSLQLGEYAFAMKDYILGIQKHHTSAASEIRIFPNPTNDMLLVDLYASILKIPNNAFIFVTDTSGKIVYKEKINPQQDILHLNTSTYSNGVYFISIKVKDALIAKNKFIVAH
ncbi:MAG: M1 family aminopeptidase [Bacteroidota bacterium]